MDKRRADRLLNMITYLNEIYSEQTKPHACLIAAILVLTEEVEESNRWLQKIAWHFRE